MTDLPEELDATGSETPQEDLVTDAELVLLTDRGVLLETGDMPIRTREDYEYEHWDRDRTEPV